MLKASLKNPVLRRRARQFGRLLRHSAVTPRTGRSYKPRLVSNGELGLTFIGHASFFVQIGGQNVVIDPNFARWAMGNIPSITPAIRLTFQDSTKSAAGWRRSSLCYRSALIIRLRSETSTPAPPMLLALSSI